MRVRKQGHLDTFRGTKHAREIEGHARDTTVGKLGDHHNTKQRVETGYTHLASCRAKRRTEADERRGR